MENNETFFPLHGYDGRYEISRKGVIRRAAHERMTRTGKMVKYPERVITEFIDGRTGYPVVKLTKPDGKYGSQFVHRLLAHMFILKPPHKNFVNHKNGDKLDYALDNLEWTTPKENSKHAFNKKLTRLPSKNKVRVINRCTGETYESLREASNKTGIPYDEVKRKVRGLRSKNNCIEKLESSD